MGRCVASIRNGVCLFFCDGPNLNSTRGLLLKTRSIWVVEVDPHTHKDQLALREHLAQTEPLWNQVRLVHADMAEFIGNFRQPIVAVYADLMGSNIEHIERIIHAMQINRCEAGSFDAPMTFASTFVSRSRHGHSTLDRIYMMDAMCEQLGNTSQGVLHWGYSRGKLRRRGANMMFNIHLVNCDEEEVCYRPRIERHNVMHNGVLCHKVKWVGFSEPDDITYEPTDFLD